MLLSPKTIKTSKVTVAFSFPFIAIALITSVAFRATAANSSSMDASKESQVSNKPVLDSSKEELSSTETGASNHQSYYKKSIQPKEHSSVISRVVPSISVIASTFVGDLNDHFQYRGDYGAGATVELGHSHFVFETGLLYRRLGAYIKDSRSTVEATYHFNYLSVPLVAKYYTGNPMANTFFIKGGLLSSFLMSKNMILKFNNEEKTSSDLPINDFDLSGVVGLGGKFPAGPGASIIFEVDYSRSLNKFSKTEVSVYNSSITLTGGIGIEL